jgi:hypothetical protein
MIWKEGAPRKIEEEIREMEEWNRLVPGLVPDVKDRYRGEDRESFLGVFLDGTLLRDIYLTRTCDQKLRVTARLLETIRDVWLATMEKHAPPVDYVRQIGERLPELYAIHPRLEALRRRETSVFGVRVRSLGDLLQRVQAIERTLAPPVTVRIHGDLNTNNVVYDATVDRVHFIDVHRSGSGDFAQDIGVLLVSNLRQPIQDRRIQTELARLNRQVESFAATFAGLVGDTHFATRLMLSQARSFITSGRLITDPDFARDIFLRGVRLLERTVAGIAA